ncbi:MAG: (d)CMP kinase [Clostridia bacterium]
MNYCITIDGPAGAGKSTIAKSLASELNYFYIDTGAMYRSVTCASILYQIDSDDEKKLSKLAKNLETKFVKDQAHYYINGLYLNPFIRSIAVNDLVSEVSVHRQVREELVKLQRKLSKENPLGGTVMEGRDTGTVVLPNAELKIFLTASLEERVRRRVEQYEQQGLEVDPDSIKLDLAKRDKIDSSREISPLKKAEDAIVLDSTNLSIEKVLEKIKNLIK